MKKKIPRDFVDELLTNISIVDVIDRQVPLTKKGDEYEACCPFHNEKTPSFTVSPAKQFYYCFGCGAHGTVIDFFMKYTNISFVEAIQELADNLGLSIPITNTLTFEDRRKNETLDRLYHLMGKVSNWFQQQLYHHPNRKQAILYLKKRGLDSQTIEKFRIGYAPDDWKNLYKVFGNKLEIFQQLIKVGLVTKRNNTCKNNEYYDRFRGRIMFPIENNFGRVVAFGGRILKARQPKYINSPATVLFHKSSELYGLHQAKEEIVNQHRSLVVEGYMDVVSLSQFGVKNVVATLGTATTRIHLQRLFRLAQEIIFCFDGDPAGSNAAWKAMQVALPEMRDGRLMSFLFLPDGSDPDSFIRSEGKDQFIKIMNSAVSFPELLFDKLIKKVDLNRIDGQAQLVNLVKPLLSRLPFGTLRTMMFARLSHLIGLTGKQLNQWIGISPEKKNCKKNLLVVYHLTSFNIHPWC